MRVAKRSTVPHPLHRPTPRASFVQPSLAVPRGRAPSAVNSHAEGMTAGGGGGGGANGGPSGDGERERSGSYSRLDGGGGPSGNSNNAGASSSSTPAEGAVLPDASGAPHGAATGAAARETSDVDAHGHGGGGAAAAATGESPSADGADGAEGAAGGYWGLSGWFSRRSGPSSPPPPPLGEEGSSEGALLDRRRISGSAPGDQGGPGRGEDGRAGAATTSAARGKGGARRTRRSQGRMAPSPLSMEVVGAAGTWQGGGAGGDSSGGGGGTGYASETDEDEDLYGKTLRPTSEQLVREIWLWDRGGVDPCLGRCVRFECGVFSRILRRLAYMGFDVASDEVGPLLMFVLYKTRCKNEPLRRHTPNSVSQFLPEFIAPALHY